VGAADVFEAAQYRRTAAKGFEVVDPPQAGTADFARLVEVPTVAPLRQGNRITVLRNGCEIFPAMLEAIRAARRTIDFATYVYWTGSIAPEFADALAERAAAGVVVNVLLDAVGAARMEPRLVERLEAAGELNISFRDPGLVATLEKHFLQDLDDARELDAATWRARSLPARARGFGGALIRREL
jgi:phosphatidylserine/phosphatidylglycerophosphate/cardiolipin synthase-like enzyme